jgi:hypothetical protein
MIEYDMDFEDTASKVMQLPVIYLRELIIRGARIFPSYYSHIDSSTRILWYHHKPGEALEPQRTQSKFDIRLNVEAERITQASETSN